MHALGAQLLQQLVQPVSLRPIGNTSWFVPCPESQGAKQTPACFVQPTCEIQLHTVPYIDTAYKI